MSSNLYEITFVADTATAVQAVALFEAEMRKLQTATYAASYALDQAAKDAQAFNAVAAGSASHLNTMTAATGHATGSLLNLTNAMQVFAMGIQVFGDLGDKINRAREKINDMTDDAIKLRDTLREIANLQHHDGPDNEVAANVLQLGIDAGMMPQEAKRFEEQFLGAIPGALDKRNIGPAGAKKEEVDRTVREIREAGAQFGTRVGLDSKTSGVFTGIMGQYGKLPDAEAAAQVMGRVQYGLNEGVGNMEPLMRTLLNTAGSLVGEDGAPMESLEELAVMEGVASTHANPYATGTRLRQAVRALRTTKGPHAEWMAKQGVKDGMNHRDRLRAIKGAVMAEAKATGKGVDQVLKMHVTDDDTEARSLAEQLGDLDMMDDRYAKMKKIRGSEVLDANKKYFEGDRSGIRRRQMAKKAAQEFTIGQENEQRRMAEENTEQVLRDKGELGGAWNSFKDSARDLFGLIPFAGGMKYRDKKLLAGATGNLIEEARRKGMSEEEIFGASGLNAHNFDPKDPGFAEASVADPMDPSRGRTPEERLKNAREANNNSYSSTWAGRSEAEAKKDFARLAKQVERRGGNVYGPSPNIEGHLKELVHETRVTQQVIRDQNRQNNAAAGAARQGAAGMGAAMVGGAIPLPPVPRPAAVAPGRP